MARQINSHLLRSSLVLDYALREAVNGHESELGFTLMPRRSRRVPETVLTDLDYAEDIALLSNDVSRAQKLLELVETECNRQRRRKSTTSNTLAPG